VLNSQQSSTVKLCLLALAEWADADGSNCYPSIPNIATRASVNEKTVRRSLDQAESAGLIQRSQKGTAQGWRRFVYLPIVPKGADTTPARSKDGVDTESAPLPSTCGLSVPNVRTLSPEGVGAESTDLSITYPVPREEANEASASNAARPVDLWADGIALLTSAGTSKEQAGATIGKLRKAVGEDEARSIVAQMLVTRPTGPKSYLYGVIRERERALGRLPRDSRSEDAIARANDEALARLGVSA
jgi:hypothetical protein